MKIPPSFRKNIIHTFGGEGEKWLAGLPFLVDRAILQWGLRDLIPFTLSYNFVAKAVLPDGKPVVLKIGAPGPEFLSEFKTLSFTNGMGFPMLLEVDLIGRMFLMELVDPGKNLLSVRSDRERTEIACRVFRNIERIPNLIEQKNFINLTDRFAGIERKRNSFGGFIPPSIPAEFHQKAQSLTKDLFKSSQRTSLIHGDLHHFNILLGENGWLAIDPKGVVGPAEYECGPFLMNPVPKYAYAANRKKIAKDRIAILSERLGYDKIVIRNWAFCHCVLSAWWDVNERGMGGEYSIQAASLFNELII